MSAGPIPRWLPNAISVVRMLLVPVWVLCAEAAREAAGSGDGGHAARAWTAGVLIAIGISDVADGWLARRLDLQSHLGETLDAVADKLAQVVLFTYLAIRTGPAFAPVPLWFLGLLVARDGLLLVGYVAIRRRHGAVNAEHRFHGKVSSLLLFGLLVAFSAGLGGAGLSWLLAISAIVLTLSTALYTRHGVRQFVASR